MDLLPKVRAHGAHGGKAQTGGSSIQMHKAQSKFFGTFFVVSDLC